MAELGPSLTLPAWWGETCLWVSMGRTGTVVWSSGWVTGLLTEPGICVGEDTDVVVVEVSSKQLVYTTTELTDGGIQGTNMFAGWVVVWSLASTCLT